MHPRCRILLSGLLVLALAACGDGGSASDTATQAPRPPVRVDARVVAAADGSLQAQWRFDVADGWHIYWHGRNDTGYPPDVDLALPAGWAAGPLRWPVPERHVAPGEILDHVHHGPEVVLVQKLTPPPDGAAGRARARVRWLACRSECVPGESTLEVGLEPVPGAAVDPGDYPTDLPANGVHTRWEGATLVVSVPGAAGLRFFPFEDCGPLVDLLADGEVPGAHLGLRLKPRDGRVGPVRGLLQISRPDVTPTTSPLDLPHMTLDNPGG